MNYIASEEIAKLDGVNTLVINALRWEKHSSHFSVDEAVEIIKRIAPKRAYLTHMSHRIGLHSELETRLPQGIYPAYDGLKIDIND